MTRVPWSGLRSFSGFNLLLDLPHQSPSLTFLLMIKRSSLGSFFKSTDDRRLPYDSGATPSNFKLRTWDSSWSYNRRSLFRLCWESTGSTFSSTSIYMSIDYLLLIPKAFLQYCNCLVIVGGCECQQATDSSRADPSSSELR